MEQSDSSDSGGELEQEEIISSAKKRQYAKYDDDDEVGEVSGSQGGSDVEMEQKQKNEQNGNL